MLVVAACSGGDRTGDGRDVGRDAGGGGDGPAAVADGGADAGGGSICRVFATAWTRSTTIAETGDLDPVEFQASWDADGSTYRWERPVPESLMSDGSAVYDGVETFVAEAELVGLVTVRSTSSFDEGAGIGSDYAYLYDEEGRLVQIDGVFDDYDDSQVTTTYTAHDEVGRRLEAITDRIVLDDDNVPPCLGIRTTFAYDDEARRVTETGYAALYSGIEVQCSSPFVAVREYDDNMIEVAESQWFQMTEPTGEPDITSMTDVEETGRICVDPPPR